MTDVHEDDDYLVRVQAQVMTRDDSTGGWVPLSGGGLANVSVRRRPVASRARSTAVSVSATPGHSPSDADDQNGQESITNSPQGTNNRYEYLIYGKRIADRSVVLSCTIKKDFQYNKVMPTFHHWRTGDKKFGLTFTTAADARAFDKGVKTAVDELLEGLVNDASHNCHTDTEDEDIFMSLNLPVDHSDIRQMAEPRRSIAPSPVSRDASSAEPADMHRPPIHYETDPQNYPYVQLTTINHDYMYPVIDDRKPDRIDDRQSPTGSMTTTTTMMKPEVIVAQPITNDAAKRVVRVRCRHCQELFIRDDNPRGTCEFSPDPVQRVIETVSCLLCAECTLYHCMSDSEGDFVQDPCSCGMEEGCCKRWLCIALLSLVTPCLWLYPPLRAMHRCGTSCGLCGGRHSAME